LWVAAALGLLDRVEELLSTGDADTDLISQAFWHACNAGQRRTAELLLDRGANLNWQPDYARGTALDAAQQRGTQQQNVIEWLRERGAGTADQLE
jgi:ankyrin repeat protein